MLFWSTEVLNSNLPKEADMPKKLLICAVMVLLVSFALAAGFCRGAWAWSNGGYSGDPAHPSYGTHDWIAQHALDWLPPAEKQFLTDHLTNYLYGTELPDNSQTPDGVGDTTKHHIYFSASGTVMDNASAVRALTEYQNAQAAYAAGNFSAAAEHLGMVAHYIGDMGVFGHVMGASTAWGAEQHHSDYEDYVLTRTDSYSGGDFDSALIFDGSLTITSAYDVSVTLARDMTFDGSAGLNCTWMDQNYNWSNSQFKGRAGASLNLTVNAVADVMHTFFQQSVVPEFSPQCPQLAAVLLAVLLVVFVLRKRPLKKAY
jgi:hypothetical protein